jgi:hypothetical protein
MTTIIWGCRGILLTGVKQRNTSVNAAYYAPILHILHDAIKGRRSGILNCGVHLLHDHAPVHTAAVAKSAVKECCFQDIDHPTYSPDLAYCGYYLTRPETFGPYKVLDN